PLLTPLALISLIALSTLALGCFSQFGCAFLHHAAARALDIELMFDRGRVTIYWETLALPPATAKIPPGTHFDWRFLRFATPDFRRIFWAFDAHPLIFP